MKEEGFSPALDIRNGIVLVADAIRDAVFYFKWYRPMRCIKDRDQRMEKIVLFELTGVRYGGMAMSGAYVDFKKVYYDTLASDEQAEIRKALLRMLRSPKYTVSQKEMVAYVCSDIGMKEATAYIVFVREAAARGMTLRQLRQFKQDRERERNKHTLSNPGSLHSREGRRIR